MASSNLKKFHAAVSAVLGVPADEVNDQVSSETVDTWDSLNHINLISALEQEFSITLPTEQMAGAQSVKSLRELLALSGIAL